ncbi:MAG: sigma-54-dependent Fis family transcriptional regulator [Deltaproteobacteria bacterium]|nr:sigma-54-dependent Fis family transcriptional regulator [Deltaproteobacteria bacterium]
MSKEQSSPKAESGARLGVLVVDDEEAITESLALTLGSEYPVYTAQSGVEGLEILDREEVALIICDQVMPGMTGVEFFEKVVERYPRIVRIMLTGYADMQSLVRAVNSGQIYRYIAKPWEPDDLRIDVRRAMETYRLMGENVRLAADLAEANERLRAENLFLRDEVKNQYAFSEIIGNSPAMQRVFQLMSKVAETDATVLITGETGTGKDLVARAIHYAGARKRARFVAQNCAALPDTLLESELFGHLRGAFTGANSDKKGLFQTADGGSIFLDEIGETEASMQTRLLRVLQDGEVRSLGSSENRNVDVRVLAATNRNLADDVKEGRFREDLYYRLRVVEVALPPLRERREDIPELAHHFLEGANLRMRRELEGFTQSAMAVLVAYTWPGNVRELANEIERVVALAGDESRVTVEMLSDWVQGAAETAELELADAGPISDWDLNRSVDRLKRRLIVESVREVGSKTGAADRLGIPRQSLQKMMKRLQISDEEVGTG